MIEAGVLHECVEAGITPRELDGRFNPLMLRVNEARDQYRGGIRAEVSASG